MANYANLKAAIADAIKYNDNHEITGEILQEQLIAIINAIGGAGYIFAGLARPDTNPGSPDSNVMYIGGAGTYSNFGAPVTVKKGQLVIFTYNGNWGTSVIDINSILPVYININEIANHPDAYADAATALADVPVQYRRKGVKVVYFDDNSQYWIEMLCYDDAGLNWWTDINNNWAIEGPIETDLVTATGGHSLYIAGDKRANLDDILNVNAWNEQIYEYDDSDDARSAVPAVKRRHGLIITYLVSTGPSSSAWIIEQFIGNDVSDWSVADNWKTIGPVSISQNAETGHVDIGVGRKSIQAAGASETDYLNRIKQKKDWGTNLVNPDTVNSDKYLTDTGALNSADPGGGFGVTDYIPVMGYDIICNGILITALNTYAVYDINKACLRTVKNNRQYTYQDGDCYIRFTYQSVVPRCNHGTVLATYVPYTENANIDKLQEDAEAFGSPSRIDDLEDYKLDEVIGTNLVNPEKCLNNKYLNSSGNVATSTEDTWCVTGFIKVNSQNIISNAYTSNSNIASYCVYDSNRKLLRAVTQNAQYTYQDGDVYVRFCMNRIPSESHANYGTALEPFEDFIPYKPLYDLDKKVDDINESLYNVVQEEAEIAGNIPSSYISNSKINTASSSDYSVNYYPVEKDKKYTIKFVTNVNTGSHIIKTTLFTTSIPALQVTGTYIIDPGQNVDAGYTYTFIPAQNGYVCLYSNAPQVIKLYNVYETSKFADLEEEIIDLEEEKLDKKLSANLINPETVVKRKYINSDGEIGNADNDSYKVSELIKVNGQNAICNGISASYARAWVVYSKDGTKFRWADQDVKQYTYQPGDYYIRFGFNFNNANSCKANYGTELIDVPYTDYKPLYDLEQRVEALENGQGGQVELTYAPGKLYRVWNDIDVKRQNVCKLGLSRMLSLDANLNQIVKFNNGLRFIPISPVTVSSVTESNLTITSGAQQKICKLRNTPASLATSIKPRILVIGDSVTSGYGANSNKAVSWHPNEYWAYAKMLFEMDKIDNGDSGHDILFVGGFISNGTFTIQYKGVNRSVRVKAEGKGGASLQELYNPTWGDGGGTTNPFYDEVNQTFSIQAYLNNYRTMDDLGVRLPSNSADPHGEQVVGSDGLTYTIGQKITTQTKLTTYDICTPTHVFMNLNHNTSEANFTANIANVVNTIKTELPGVKFAWLCIDSTGTNFPCDYPDFSQSMVRFNSLHTKNNGFYQYFQQNIENEAQDIYLLGMNFIQPEGIDYPFVEIEQNGGYGATYKIPNSSVAGAQWHPNNIAHAEWGYELYAFIKWLISKDL